MKKKKDSMKPGYYQSMYNGNLMIVYPNGYYEFFSKEQGWVKVKASSLLISFIKVISPKWIGEL